MCNLLKKLNIYFDRSITKTIDKLDRFDYTDSKYNYILKHRKYEKNSYKFISISLLKLHTNTIYLYNFNNKLYYIKYNINKFNSFFKKECIDANTKTKKMFVFIPVKYFKKVKIENIEIIDNLKEFKVYF